MKSIPYKEHHLKFQGFLWWNQMKLLKSNEIELNKWINGWVNHNFNPILFVYLIICLNLACQNPQAHLGNFKVFLIFKVYNFIFQLYISIC